MNIEQIPEDPGDGVDPSFIRKAYLTSLVVLALLMVALIGGAWRWKNLFRSPTDLTSIGLNLERSRGISPPRAQFVDITASSGINFVHQNGATGKKYLPETMGGGVAFFDFDQDSDQDLLFVNSGKLPTAVAPDRKQPNIALYKNDGKGQFTLVPEAGGLNTDQYGMGVAIGDYNADGWPDVFLSAVSRNRLFRNTQGRFYDVTEEARVGGTADAWSTSCCFADFAGDEHLDLVVCNYVRWSPEADEQINYSLPGIGRAYGPPFHYRGMHSYLYVNNGDLTFTDISAASGIQIANRATGLPMGKALGVCPIDINLDGKMDFVVANDTVQNFVFLNQGNGEFDEIGATSGLAFDSFGATRGAMGIDADRFLDPDTLGISIGNFANEMTALYVARRNSLLFADEAYFQGIGTSSLPALTFGVFFFDYDLDGRLDLLTSNGHIEPRIGAVHAKQQYLQTLQLFWNTGMAGANGFALVPPEQSTPDFSTPLAGRGSAYADIDGDGDLDVVICQVNGPARLFRNEHEPSGRWLRLSLRDNRKITSNPFALGAQVRVQTQFRSLGRRAVRSRGYLSHSEHPITIGLEANERIESIVVTWPDGTAERHLPAALNKSITISR